VLFFFRFLDKYGKMKVLVIGEWPV
jgi:hypothetical protein